MAEGPELITNGTFESNINGWSQSGATSWVWTGSGVIGDGKNAYLNVTDFMLFVGPRIYQDFSVPETGQYRIRFDWRSELYGGIDGSTNTDIVIDPITLVHAEMSGGSPDVAAGSYDQLKTLSAGTRRIDFHIFGTPAFDASYWRCWWDNVSVKQIVPDPVVGPDKTTYRYG